jgi:integrase
LPTFKRKGIWYARAEIGSQRIEQSAGKGASQTDAKELEAALFKRLSDDRHAKRVGRGLNRTFGEALLTYMLMPETQQLRSYQSLKSVANLIRIHLESVRLEDTPEKAQEMKQAFIAEGLQYATINRRLAMVRRILRLAYYEWKWLKAPLAVTLLTENNERHIYPPVELARAIAEHCPSKDNGDALLVMYWTGMREGELMKVNANPQDYIEGKFIKLYSGHKTKKPGRVPIVKEIAQIIARMPLKVTKHSLRVNWETARAAVSRTELHKHDFRHGYASIIAEAGGDFMDIMKLLRHVSPQSTKRYTHLLDTRLRRVVGRAEKLAVGKR